MTSKLFEIKFSDLSSYKASDMWRYILIVLLHWCCWFRFDWIMNIDFSPLNGTLFLHVKAPVKYLMIEIKEKRRFLPKKTFCFQIVPTPLLMMAQQRVGLVVRMDLQGRITGALMDTNGSVIQGVTEAREHAGMLYLGNFDYSYLGRLDQSCTSKDSCPYPPTVWRNRHTQPSYVLTLLIPCKCLDWSQKEQSAISITRAF